MAGELSKFEKNRLATIVEEAYVMDQIDAGDLPPTPWVRNDWNPKPRVPSGATPLGHPGLHAVTCFAGSKARNDAIAPHVLADGFPRSDLKVLRGR
jgi:hypothetical protein